MNKSVTWIVLALIAIVVVVGAVNYLNKPDDRNALQRLGDAAEEMPNVDQAADQLGDRSPAEKAGDAIEEATDGDGK